jgi:hypothetical protein
LAVPEDLTSLANRYIMQNYPIYSESRVTRAPVLYGHLQQYDDGITNGIAYPPQMPMNDQDTVALIHGLSRKYAGNPDAMKLVNQLQVNPRGAVVVDPRATEETGDTTIQNVIKHELVHNWLDLSPANSSELRKFHSSNPIARQAVQAFKHSDRDGEAATELPAYMVNYEPNVTPNIDRTSRDQYLSVLYKFLNSKQPGLADSIAKLQ